MAPRVDARRQVSPEILSLGLLPLGPGGEQRLIERVNMVVSRTQFYRRLYGVTSDFAAPIRRVEEFAALPFTTKSSVADDQHDRAPFGTLLATDRSEIARMFCVAGSIYMFHSRGDVDALARSQAAMWEIAGVGPGDLVDISMSYHWVMGGSTFDDGFRMAGAAVLPGGPGQTSLRIKVLLDAHVTVLQTFTTYAETLIDSIEEAGIDPKRLGVRLLIIGGELRDKAAKGALADRWRGLRVIELYGTSETGVVGIECPEAADGMHVSPDVAVQVVDPNTGLPTDPALGGELVLTELIREAQPFLRLRTGDIVEKVMFGECACGRTTPRLGRILGRRGELVRVKGVFIHPKIIDEMLRLRGVALTRLVVDRPEGRDRVTLEVSSVNSSETVEFPDLQTRLQDRFGISFRLLQVRPTSQMEHASIVVVDQRSSD